jgi:hypothetical protein
VDTTVKGAASAMALICRQSEPVLRRVATRVMVASPGAESL